MFHFTDQSLEDPIKDQKEAGFKRPSKRRREEPKVTEVEKQSVGKDETLTSKEESQNDAEFHPSTVFVGDLGDFTDEAELDMAFSRFGPIESIRRISGKKWSPFFSLMTVLGLSAFVLRNRRKEPSRK